MSRFAMMAMLSAWIGSTNVAYAKDCVIIWHSLILPPLHVEFEEHSSGGVLRLLGTVVSEPILFELEREVVTVVETGKKSTALVGEETIRDGKISNQIRAHLWDKSSPSGDRVIGFNVTVLLDNFSPVEHLNGGVLHCY